MVQHIQTAREGEHHEETQGQQNGGNPTQKRDTMETFLARAQSSEDMLKLVGICSMCNKRGDPFASRLLMVLTKQERDNTPEL